MFARRVTVPLDPLGGIAALSIRINKCSNRPNELKTYSVLAPLSERLDHLSVNSVD